MTESSNANRLSEKGKYGCQQMQISTEIRIKDCGGGGGDGVRFPSPSHTEKSPFLFCHKHSVQSELSALFTERPVKPHSSLNFRCKVKTYLFSWTFYINVQGYFSCCFLLSFICFRFFLMNSTCWDAILAEKQISHYISN